MKTQLSLRCVRILPFVLVLPLLMMQFVIYSHLQNIGGSRITANYHCCEIIFGCSWLNEQHHNSMKSSQIVTSQHSGDSLSSAGLCSLNTVGKQNRNGYTASETERGQFSDLRRSSEEDFDFGGNGNFSDPEGLSKMQSVQHRYEKP